MFSFYFMNRVKKNNFFQDNVKNLQTYLHFTEAAFLFFIKTRREPKARTLRVKMCQEFEVNRKHHIP